MESKNKIWRFSSEDEFLDYAIEYVTNHIDNMVERIDTFDKAKKLKSKIKDYYFIYRFRYTNKYDLLKIGISIVIEDVDNWREFSSDAFSPLKDIVTRAILGKMFGTNYVCYTLLYHNENITLADLDNQLDSIHYLHFDQSYLQASQYNAGPKKNHYTPLERITHFLCRTLKA